MQRLFVVLLAICGGDIAAAPPSAIQSDRQEAESMSAANARGHHHEAGRDPWLPRPIDPPQGVRMGKAAVSRGPFISVQVNVDALGNNIPGDAANEPTIAIDPTNPNRIVIGWRQFDNVASNFRQSGVGYSHDAGVSWTFDGPLTPGIFGSDPVLDVDSGGVFYYASINSNRMRLARSFDGGVTWEDPLITILEGFHDKEWMAIDRSGGIGDGHVYLVWTDFLQFTRSTDGGISFMSPIATPVSFSVLGTLSVGPSGELYVVDWAFRVAKSTDAMNSTKFPTFSPAVFASMPGSITGFGGPNPAGLLGQAWIATDHSQSLTHGNVYVLGSIAPFTADPLDVYFARSIDGGQTWSEAIRVNDDPSDNGALQWFGTMSVAPNGRIDAIWNDTRSTGQVNLSELYYSYSMDAGVSWSRNMAVSPVFNSFVGWPNNNKLGDYYGMVSDNTGANIAYAATFNGEQDVYFLRIGDLDCNENGIPDLDDILSGFSDDCNLNEFPDDCERDCNENKVADTCDIADLTSPDCNGNLVPDECDPNFDGDEFIDGCDDDIDNDMIDNAMDVCDFTPLGTPIQPDGRPRSDTNGNCRIDLIDYSRFQLCLAQSGPDDTGIPSFCTEFFDLDNDGDVDLKDYSRMQKDFGP